MMRFVSAALLLSCMKATLLCLANVLPPSANSRLGNTDRDSLKLLASIRQELTCISREDCGEGLLCIQPVGESICEEECEGFCIPEELRNRICNCEDPCETGICVNPFLDTDADTGMCVTNDGTPGLTSIKCPDSSGNPNKPNKPGVPENGEVSDGPPGSGESNDDDPSSSTEPQVSSSEPEVSPSEPESAASDPVGSDSNESPPENGSGPMSSESGSDNIATDPENASASEADSGDRPAPTSSESTIEGVCIGADMLDKFESHQLVFPKHVLSRVLCDAFGSCATSGHIVEYRGRGMMMRSYCSVVGCSEKVMYVNSPKFQSGLRVRSRSGGMKFTSFAARYATCAEEVVLCAVVKVGL